MRNIAAKNHRSSFWEPHKQRLVAGSVSGCGEQHDASVAKDIVVAVYKLYWMLLVKGHGVLSAPGPFVLDFCTNMSVLGNISMFPAWSGWLCDTAISVMSEGSRCISSS